MWPNLAKFCHLDKLSKIWGKLFGFILCLAKFWVFFVNFGQIRAVVTVSSQIMKNNLAIWSHCLLHSLTVCVASAASCSSQQRHTTELLSFTTFAAFWHFYSPLHLFLRGPMIGQLTVSYLHLTPGPNLIKRMYLASCIYKQSDLLHQNFKPIRLLHASTA